MANKTKRKIRKFKYYDIRDDIKLYPYAWAYLIWSERGPGKTYSTLRMMIEDDYRFMFMKRTNDDIDMLCASAGNRRLNFDISPFVPLNRDFGWNIKPVKIQKGLAGFYRCDEENNPAGCPLGYAVSLNIAGDVKGFDLSECDYMIFDEFIPKPYERVSRKEGDALLDIYMTVRRDRLQRGRPDLKLVCLANATSINNPTFNILEVVDTVAEMDVANQEYFYSERGIMLHKIPATDIAPEDKQGIELAMEGTEWADMAFGGNFAYDDFSNVKHNRIKGYTPVCGIIYKRKTFYVYMKNGNFYMTYAKAPKAPVYDLNTENDQKRFFYDYQATLRNACINDRMKFEKYTMYDLIINYKKIFKIT